MSRMKHIVERENGEEMIKSIKIKNFKACKNIELNHLGGVNYILICNFITKPCIYLYNSI